MSTVFGPGLEHSLLLGRGLFQAGPAPSKASTREPVYLSRRGRSSLARLGPGWQAFHCSFANSTANLMRESDYGPATTIARIRTTGYVGRSFDARYSEHHNLLTEVEHGWKRVPHVSHELQLSINVPHWFELIMRTRVWCDIRFQITGGAACSYRMYSSS